MSTQQKLTVLRKQMDSGGEPPSGILLENLGEQAKQAQNMYFLYLSFIAFCLLTLFSIHDRDVILNGGKVTLPIASVQVDPLVFFSIGPILCLLLFITFHLHLLRLSRLAKASNANPESAFAFMLYYALTKPEVEFSGKLQVLIAEYSAYLSIVITLLFFTFSSIKMYNILVLGLSVLMLWSSIIFLIYFHTQANWPVVSTITPLYILLIALSFSVTAWGIEFYFGMDFFPKLMHESISDLQGEHFGLTSSFQNDLQMLDDETNRKNYMHNSYWFSAEAFKNFNYSFRYSNLNNTTWIKAALAQVDFSHSRLKHSRFIFCKLSYANFTDTDLSFADFEKSDLSRANLAKGDLFRSNFAGSNLSGANLAKGDLGGSNFVDANLTGADLSRSNLLLANFSNADLTDANLIDVYLVDNKFMRSLFIGDDYKFDGKYNLNKIMDTLREVSKSKVDLTNANVHGAIFSERSLLSVKLSEDQLQQIRIVRTQPKDQQMTMAKLLESPREVWGASQRPSHWICFGEVCEKD